MVYTFLIFYHHLCGEISTHLVNIKTYLNIISLSKYPVKYLELFFVSIKLEITILSTSTSQFFIIVFFPL